MTDSQQLLADYAAKRSETAFRELVSRYIDLVYSTAVRLVDGDTHRARDVAQVVFADLARTAGRLSPHTMLGGWLHRHTCFVARTLMRGERRRQVRERHAMEMSALENQPDAALAEIASVLDEAIHELGADDRDAILLRFFERRNLRSVGEALGTSENVAQKRVSRAVQELAVLLRRRGYAVPAAALATGLAASAVKAAPAGLALSIVAKVCGGAGTAAGAGAASVQATAASNLKLGIIAALSVATLVTILLMHNQHKANSAVNQTVLPAEPDPPSSAEASQPETAAAEPAGVVPAAPLQPISRVPVQAPPVVTPPPRIVPEQVTTTVAVPARPVAGLVLPARRLFVARSGSKMTIQGTANILHSHWWVESSFIGGSMEVGSDFPTEPGQVMAPGRVGATAQAFVAVRSLKSVEEDGRPYSDRMDDIMRSQLKEAQFRRITYVLDELVLKEPPRSNGAPYVCAATGALTIAGVTNRTTMLVNVLPVSGGKEKRLEITGKTVLRTTDYGVSPVDVNLMVGHIKTGTDVTLTFKWVLGERTSPETPPASIPADVQNLAPGSTVTCSDKAVAVNDLAKITDGDKESSEQSILFLRKGTQWVQLDFGRPQELLALVIWHAYNLPKAYHDVIVQVADDPDFRKNVHTLFNNDRDNSSGRRKGSDPEYQETSEGKLIDAKGITARCLRFYSKGSTESALNEYTEIEVYGRPGR